MAVLRIKSAFIAVVTVLLTLTQACAMEPFGLDAVPSQSASLNVIWRDLQQQLAEDASKIKLCRLEQACGSAAARRLISIVDEARRFGGRQMIGHLNRSINGAIPTTRANVPWLSPLAALDQAGDCKSYALAKYLALADAGIAASDRRLVMLKVTTLPAERHLAVLVRQDERWLILDNRTLTLVDSTATQQYAPLHEFDENGVRDFEALQ